MQASSDAEEGPFRCCGQGSLPARPRATVIAGRDSAAPADDSHPDVAALMDMTLQYLLALSSKPLVTTGGGFGTAGSGSNGMRHPGGRCFARMRLSAGAFTEWQILPADSGLTEHCRQIGMLDVHRHLGPATSPVEPFPDQGRQIVGPQRTSQRSSLRGPWSAKFSKSWLGQWNFFSQQHGQQVQAHGAVGDLVQRAARHITSSWISQYRTY